MPGADLLLDSNIVAAVLNAEPAALRCLKAAGRVGIPAIVVGEVYFGALNSRRRDENISRLDAFLQTAEILSVGLETARTAARIRLALKLSGRPIPENDLWIAAVAVEQNLMLVTRDGHFGVVPDLRITDWF